MASNMWKEAQLHLSDKLRYSNQIKLLQYPFLSTRPVGIKTKILCSAGKDKKKKKKQIPADKWLAQHFWGVNWQYFKILNVYVLWTAKLFF